MVALRNLHGYHSLLEGEVGEGPAIQMDFTWRA